MSRISANDYFMKLAAVASERSTCRRQQVGAVLVRDGRVLSMGYNGAPRGVEHCLEVGCNRPDAPHGTQYENCIAVHAEMNCIISAARHGVSTEGGVLYCTHQPCLQCAKAIINSGIACVIYTTDLGMAEVTDLLVRSDVSVCRM